MKHARNMKGENKEQDDKTTGQKRQCVREKFHHHQKPTLRVEGPLPPTPQGSFEAPG